MAVGIRGRVLISSLTSTPQTAFAAGEKAHVEAILISGGAADRVVVFQSENGAIEFFRSAVKAGDTNFFSMEFPVPAQGLRVVTTAAAGDVFVTLLYYGTI